jgi:hypothetical protein
MRPPEGEGRLHTYICNDDGCATLCLAFLCANLATAQADAPIRTVVYEYSFDSRTFAGSSPGSGSATGQITVDVIAATPDGGLVVNVTQSVDRAARELQTIRCALYGPTTDVVCDQNVGSTGEETALLTFFGRGFYDTGRLDTKGHWRTSPRIRNGQLTDSEDFTVTKTDGNQVTIAVDQEQRNGNYRSSATGTVVYDAAMDIPDAVHLVAAATNSAGEEDTNISLTLVSDSMAKATGSTSH